jgi:hypothetical protein
MLVFHRSLQYFNCRWLYNVGTFAREDYSIECNGDYYDFFAGVAALNIILYPVGIPVFFYLLIKNRYRPWALVASVPLHSNFTNEWAFYEVFELFRKLLLTSVVGFVAPGSATQCLFLFAVDTTALLILTLCRPYAFDADDYLSGVLTLFECIIFLITFLIVSGVYETDEYSYTAMMDLVYSLVLVGLVILVPLNIISKVPSLRSKVVAAWEFTQRKTHVHVPDEVAMVVLALDARARYRRDSEDFRASNPDFDPSKSRLSKADSSKAGLSEDDSSLDGEDDGGVMKSQNSTAPSAPPPQQASPRAGRGSKRDAQWFSNPVAASRPRQRSSPSSADAEAAEEGPQQALTATTNKRAARVESV